MTAIYSIAIPVLLVAVALILVVALFLRVVVPTNAVHIVQSGKKTVSYGNAQTDGNTYYKWPAWLPLIGVRVTVLPVSVFSQNLADYAAYDKGRVPFIIDIIAFFRITDSNVAAQRVSSFQDLGGQLQFILKGVIRTILAQSEIDQILEGRSQFGQMFTAEVDANLREWGVQTVKQIELMDIRDAIDSKVIANIMAKKKSLIEMESRTAVAQNMQKALTAEIDAQRSVDVQRQDAAQQVGLRTAQQSQEVGIANQRAIQAVREQEAVTATRTMAVTEVNQVRQAEINRAAEVVQADQARQVAVLAAEGALGAAKLHAEGVKIEGDAKGAAETAVLMAPVQTQITLAKEIGTNQGYQTYLVSVRQIEANQIVGIEQAKALAQADVKVIANTGAPIEGVKSVMELFTAKGGTQLGAAIEALSQTPAGAAIIARLAPEKRPNGGA